MRSRYRVCILMCVEQRLHSLNWQPHASRSCGPLNQWSSHLETSFLTEMRTLLGWSRLQLSKLAAGTLVAWSDLVSLTSLLPDEETCLEESEPKPPKTRISRSDADTSLLAEHPWLRGLGASLGAASSSEALPLDGVEAGNTQEAGESHDIVETADREIFHALRTALRADNSEETVTETDDSMFSVSILGGKWNVQRTGRKLYGSRYDVRKDTAAHKCCTLHGMKLSASFDYHAHGEDMSKALGKLFQAKIMHVTRYWLSTGSEEKVTTCPRFVLPPELIPPESSQKMSYRRWTEYLNMGPAPE
eukprot:4108631-Amphidinium_carterae.2